MSSINPRPVSPSPEIQRLHQLVDEFRLHPDFNSVTTMATLYQRGAYPRLRPNDMLASELFRAAAIHCPNPVLSAQAMRMYMEVFAAPVEAEDRAGEHMPVEPGQDMLALIEEVRRQENTYWNMDWEIAMGLAWDEDHAAEAANHERVPDQFSQTAHDHAVVRTVQKTLELLPAPERNFELAEIRAAISSLNELSSAQRMDAMRVLDASSVVKRDREALGKVWKRIQEEPDPVVRGNRVETLGKELASAVENGEVVCSTGRISRMVTALQGRDDAADDDKDVPIIRTTDAVAQELMQLAAFVRSQVLADASHVNRLDYASGEASTKFISDEMERRFKERVQEIYVKDLGMSSAILEPIVKPIVEMF